MADGVIESGEDGLKRQEEGCTMEGRKPRRRKSRGKKGGTANNVDKERDSEQKQVPDKKEAPNTGAMDRKQAAASKKYDRAGTKTIPLKARMAHSQAAFGKLADCYSLVHKR